MSNNVSKDVNISLYLAVQKVPRVHLVSHRASSGNSSPRSPSMSWSCAARWKHAWGKIHRGQWHGEYPQTHAGPRRKCSQCRTHQQHWDLAFVGRGSSVSLILSMSFSSLGKFCWFARMFSTRNRVASSMFILSCDGNTEWEGQCLPWPRKINDECSEGTRETCQRALSTQRNLFSNASICYIKRSRH